MKCQIALGVILLASLAMANDHNNLDSGRPLRFDDAYSIAFRERALEFGMSLDTFRRNRPDYGIKAEYKVGFAKNQDIGIAFHPFYSGDEGAGKWGEVELSYFHGLRREIDNTPALAYRLDLAMPTDRDKRGAEVRLRGIATKAFRQFDKMHLNVDAQWATSPDPDEREVTFGAILGYSMPLGYPRAFDQTLVAEFALQQGIMRGDGYTGTIGLGLRRQMSPRAVLDFGVESDVFAPASAKRAPFRMTIGYSTAF